MSLKGLVDPAQQDVVREERRILSDLRTSLVRFGASDDNMAPLERSIEQLDELFLLVVVGEFNAGKSAFINALAGQRVVEEGVTPTTAQVTPVRIDDINIVDTPGTNAIIREHERITSDFVPRADLVLFVTSADRPFTETERAVPRADPRLGQEDRRRHQQDRHPRRRERDRRRFARTWRTTRDGCSASRPRSSRSARRPRSARRTASRSSGPPAASSRSSATSSRRWTRARGRSSS